MSRLRWLLLLAVGVGGTGCGVKDEEDYRAVLAAARLEVVETPDLRLWDLDLGEGRPGRNTFRVAVMNRTGDRYALGLDLRTVPGYWYRPNWQRAYRFDLHPHEVRLIEAPYEFTRLATEGALRVRLGRVEDDEGSVVIVDRLFEAWYHLGKGNPAAFDPEQSFDMLATEHIDLYAWKGSPAARDLAAIADRREAALGEIAAELGVEFTERIRLVFYPDSATKTGETGHVGAGWASGTTIVEIYDELVRLDPYHEIAHVVARRLGAPPALFNEGYAVYVAERLGADALERLGYPGLTVDAVACESARQGVMIPLDSLFGYTEIGSAASNPPVAYPQAASVVKHLVEQYGVEVFRRAYGALENTDEPAGIGANAVTFETLYGSGLGEMEREWRLRIGCP